MDKPLKPMKALTHLSLTDLSGYHSGKLTKSWLLYTKFLCEAAIGTRAAFVSVDRFITAEKIGPDWFLLTSCSMQTMTEPDRTRGDKYERE